MTCGLRHTATQSSSHNLHDDPARDERYPRLLGDLARLLLFAESVQSRKGCCTSVEAASDLRQGEKSLMSFGNSCLPPESPGLTRML